MADDELRHASLEVLKGKEPGTKLALATGTATFGRAPGNTHVVHDTAMSRQHAKIFVRDGRHWIADLNSSHGTFVNGTKITLQTLVEGDEIKLGATVLRYVATARQATLPSPPTSPPLSSSPPPKPLPAAPKLHPPDAGTGTFELELPDLEPTPGSSAAASSGVSASPPAAPARSPATSGPLPPIATGYRRAFTLEGEDPFAEAAPDPKPEPARGGAPPAIEMRGETARQFASRGAAQPVPATSQKSATAHLPPPIAARRRVRSPFSFLRDELDQRGSVARFAALILALAAAAGLFWLALRFFDGSRSVAPGDPASEGAPDETGPTAPSRPALPTRHRGD